MAVELSYVLLTPYSIRKSRTGGIVSRLLSRTGLELVAARLFSPSAELVEKYAAGMCGSIFPRRNPARSAAC
jgi:nucleoside diphosphate kinase